MPVTVERYEPTALLIIGGSHHGQFVPIAPSQNRIDLATYGEEAATGWQNHSMTFHQVSFVTYERKKLVCPYYDGKGTGTIRNLKREVLCPKGVDQEDCIDLFLLEVYGPGY